MGIFGNRKKERIKVLKKTKPGMCGGTDATQDLNAPKVIKSGEMVLFDVCSRLPYMSDGVKNESLFDIYAFAAPAGGYAFVYEKARTEYVRREETSAEGGRWALVPGVIFEKLTSLVAELNLAAKNGFHSTTHGLPENFGGSVRIRYASGERIDYSDNQSPVLSLEAGMRIHEAFTEAFEGETVELPGADEIAKIIFCEKREKGGFTEATLTFSGDGTGMNSKRSKYESPDIYASEKPVDAETAAKIRSLIDTNGLFAWQGLPAPEYKFSREKSMKFVLKDGREIEIGPGDVLPNAVRHAFFDIELEMTTKH